MLKIVFEFDVILILFLKNHKPKNLWAFYIYVKDENLSTFEESEI